MPWQLITTALGETAAPGPSAPPTLVERLWRALGLDEARTGSPRLSSVGFTIALVALSAKLAKSDGVALSIEAATFERLHHIVASERQNLRDLFDQSARDVAGFDESAATVARLLRRNRELLHDVLEGLFHIAAADGILHPEEERHLKLAATVFGLSETEFRAMRGLFVHDPSDPYTVLGIEPSVDNATLKLHFRKLVREHHPDHLIARGMPAEFIAFATSKLAEINAAYDAIAKDRGL